MAISSGPTSGQIGKVRARSMRRAYPSSAIDTNISDQVGASIDVPEEIFFPLDLMMSAIFGLECSL